MFSMSLSSNSADRYLAGAFFVVLLAFAIYQRALWFVPAAADDLRILSSVSQTRDPLSYFATDWGMQNTYWLTDGRIDTKRRTYRPLHSISIWLGYRMFGVRAYPNQRFWGTSIGHAGTSFAVYGLACNLGLGSPDLGCSPSHSHTTQPCDRR